jgi:glutathione synthase/RimK-type ligase-like ATP-grasp enzyme
VQTLSGVSGCTVPQADRLTRKELAAWKRFPLLIRPIDTHAGRGLEKIDAPDDLAQYLAKSGEARFDAVPFVDYRNDDGYYRKYRVVLVDGVPYPYHLAISPGWMVHYIKTPTASVKWMRDEELRFLRDPHSVFTSWDRTFTEMAQAMGLDYFGIDCALLPDGNVLVFEVDTAMLVHCREPADSYKHQYVPRIFRAVEALLAKR